MLGVGETLDEVIDRAIHIALVHLAEQFRQVSAFPFAYPGVVAATLMTLRTPPNTRLGELLPVVRYAVERRIASGKPDYWDHATMLEVAVLAKDESGATDALAKALPAIREPWEPETTARNLRLIREAREARGETLSWAGEIEQQLKRRPRRNLLC